MTTTDRYFVLCTSQTDPTAEKLMEIDEPLYQWLSNLGVSNPASGEPNLFIVEKYQDSLYISCNKIERAYSGLQEISGDTLVRSYHYFLHLKSTRQKPFKQKPFLLQELRAKGGAEQTDNKQASGNTVKR